MVAPVTDWDTDPSGNDNQEGIPMYEGMTPAQLNDSIRAIMAAVKAEHNDRVGAEGEIESNVDDALAAALASVAASIAALTGFLTGDLKITMATAIPGGWLLMNGSTIGSAASGGTARANADTEALFTLLWDGYTNVQLVIQDSAGAPTTRGASAAADYAANKRMPLFDGRDEFFRMASATNILGTKYADSVKDHTHTSQLYIKGGAAWSTGSVGSGPFTDPAATGSGTTGVAAPNNGGTETKPRNLAVNVFIKL